MNAPAANHPNLDALVASLTPPQRRVLVAIARHEKKWERRMRENPRRIRELYMATGPDKRAARALLDKGLIGGGSSFLGNGADIFPSDLGLLVAPQCPEWNVIDIGSFR